MIDTAPLRAVAAASEGDISLTKAQLAQLLDEIETGQFAKRELKRLAVQVNVIEGIGRVQCPN